MTRLRTVSFRTLGTHLLFCLLLHQVHADDQQNGGGEIRNTDESQSYSQLSLSGVITNGVKHDYCTAVKSAGDYIVSFDVQTSPKGAIGITLYGCSTLHMNMTLFDPMGKQVSQVVSQPFGLPGVYWTCDVHYMCGTGAQILYDWMPLLGMSFSLPSNVGLPSGPAVNISYLVMKVAYAPDATDTDYGSLQGLRVRYDNSVSIHAAAYMIMSASRQQLLPDGGTKVEMTCAFESVIGVQHFSDDPVIAPSSSKDERFVLTYIKNSTDKSKFYNHGGVTDDLVKQQDNWNSVLKWYLLNKGRDLRLPKTMYGLDSQQKELTVGDYMLVRCTNDSSPDRSKLYFVFPNSVDVCCFVRTSNLNIKIDRRDRTLRKLCSPPNQATTTPVPVVEEPIAVADLRDDTRVAPLTTPSPQKLDETQNKEVPQQDVSGDKTENLPTAKSETPDKQTPEINGSGDDEAKSKEGGMKSGHCALMDLYLKLQNGTVTLPHRASKKTGTPEETEDDAEDDTEDDFKEAKDTETIKQTTETVETVEDKQNKNTTKPLWKQAGEKYKQASDWVAERTGLSNASITLIPIACGIVLFCFMLICCIAVVRRRGGICNRRSEWSALRPGDRAYDRELLIRADEDADDEDDAGGAEDEHFTRTARRPVSLNGRNGSAAYSTHRLVVE